MNRKGRKKKEEEEEIQTTTTHILATLIRTEFLIIHEQRD